MFNMSNLLLGHHGSGVSQCSKGHTDFTCLPHVGEKHHSWATCHVIMLLVACSRFLCVSVSYVLPAHLSFFIISKILFFTVTTFVGRPPSELLEKSAENIFGIVNEKIFRIRQGICIVPIRAIYLLADTSIGKRDSILAFVIGCNDTLSHFK